MRSSRRGLGVVLGAAIALTTLPAAGMSFVDHARTAWKAKIPAGWKLTTNRKYGLDPRQVRHTFRSPNRNGVLRVNLRPDKGGDFKKLVVADFARARARVSDPKMLVDKIVKEGNDTISLKVFEGRMVRNRFMRPYLTARVLVRRPENKMLATFTLSMTHERLDRFMKTLDTFLDSFKYLDPKPPKLAPAKPSVKK